MADIVFLMCSIISLRWLGTRIVLEFLKDGWVLTSMKSVRKQDGTPLTGLEFTKENLIRCLNLSGVWGTKMLAASSISLTGNRPSAISFSSKQTPEQHNTNFSNTLGNCEAKLYPTNPP